MGQTESTPAAPAPLLGLMQHHELLVSSLLDHAVRNHGEVEIVSRRVEGDVHRYTYRDLDRRAKLCARALKDLPAGSRVATLAWNGYRHLEAYFAVSGTQRVLHTLNPRLPPDQLVYICNHAEDRVLLFDRTFLPLVAAVHAQCPTIELFVLLGDTVSAEDQAKVPGLVAYEQWIDMEEPDLTWPSFDERSASTLCYTSGTTNHPKGCLYSHRSTVLHAMASALPDALNLSARECVLAVVPMFHVNAWGLPFSAAMCGTKLVLPGPALDGKSVYALLEAERVTMAAGVPTVWQMLLAYVGGEQVKFTHLRRTVIGGSACPPAMLRQFRDEYQVDVIHAWGMTELSPLGSVCRLKNSQLDGSLTEEEQVQVLLKQGRAPFGVELKIASQEDGRTALAWDGQQPGLLLTKGHWVISEYYGSQGKSVLDGDGYFDTGDVAVMDELGFMLITDRVKDIVKSGGEWISSINVENVAMAHPGVLMAACVGIAHPKWDERPIIVVQRKPGQDTSKEEVLAFFEGKLAKWQIPDDCVFLDQIPLGATGKMQKTKIRELLKGYVLPSLRQE